jgi:two-component response regulator ARR-B family
MVSKSLEIVPELTLLCHTVLSANEEMETMMKGVKHGACDYLVKPVHLDRLKNIWLHVVKKGKNDPRNYACGAGKDASQKHQSSEEDGNKSEKNGADDSKKCSRKNKKYGDDPEEDGERSYSSVQKRQRIQWSADLHRKFVEVVHHVGIDSKSSLFVALLSSL